MNNYENFVIQNDLKEISKSGIDFNKFNNKSILITGATGMLASYIAYFLIYLNENIDAFNCKINLLVRNKEKCIKRYGKYLEKNYINVFECDLTQELNISYKIDYIIHAASIATTDMFSKVPVDVILPNSLGTYRLLELAEKNKVDGFLFFSTNVCGEIDNIKELTEDCYGAINNLNINNCYIEAKRFGETLCKSYYMQKNVKTFMVRIFHTYGPTVDLDNDKRVFSEFVKNVINNENIIMKSSGSQIRDFCYISDATEAFLRVLLYGNPGEVYNICNPNEKKSIFEIASMLSEIYHDREIQVITKEREECDTYKEKNSFNDNLFINIDKIKDLGWNPKVDVREGFIRTIESFEECKNEKN